jgi:two-component system cell cycle response regulator
MPLTMPARDADAHPMSSRTVFRAVWMLAVAGVVVHALQAGFEAFGPGADGAVHNGVYNALLVLAALLVFARAPRMGAEARAWRMFGAALAAWAAGDVTFTVLYSTAQSPPYPSVADAFWLTSYPLTVIALGMLVRARTRGLSQGGIWIDAGLGACAVTSVAAALVFGPVLGVTGGTAATVATNLAYPVGDLLLFAIVMAMFALTGWRPGRGLAMIAAALLVRAGADSTYLLQVAEGTYTSGGLLDTLWPVASLLLAGAAWQPAERRAAAVEGWMTSVFPAIFTLTALALLFYDHFHRISLLALALSSGTVALAALRMLVMLRDSRQAHERSSAQAVTDPLTGLANRRALMRDLEAALEDGDAAAARILGLFDLDGFKHYNDTFGHPAGDALLARIGLRLRETIAPYGAAYRIGGDEFCVLLAPGAAGGELAIRAATAALSESGEGFKIDSSYGTALLPTEAATVTAAMQLADTRMYRQKDGRTRSGAAHACEALIRAQRERLPGLDPHIQDVAALAVAVGRRLGLDAEGIDELGRAAQLHDIGKVAVPDAILAKTSPLSDPEVAFLRGHTLIGQRIVGMSPALAGIGRLIRASHERLDGAGYPDRLAGEAIPLGARIVSVCDAYDAMVSGRSYRPARSPAAARAELRRCAGSQFDAEVVEAFCAETDPAGRQDQAPPAIAPARD